MKFLNLTTYFLLIFIFMFLLSNGIEAKVAALVIGVAGDSSKQAISTVSMFDTFLRNNGIQSNRLLEKNATLKNVIGELEKLTKKSNSEKIIIYITAHGNIGNKDNDLYIFFDESKMPNWLSGKQLLNIVNRIPIKTLLILEVCHSGVFENREISDNLTILTASKKNERAHTKIIEIWERNYKGSVFTYEVNLAPA